MSVGDFRSHRKFRHFFMPTQPSLSTPVTLEWGQGRSYRSILKGSGIWTYSFSLVEIRRAVFEIFANVLPIDSHWKLAIFDIFCAVTLTFDLGAKKLWRAIARSLYATFLGNMSLPEMKRSRGYASHTGFQGPLGPWPKQYNRCSAPVITSFHQYQHDSWSHTKLGPLATLQD